ncbi:MAG TPA: glutathionylspermidine synthase family protein [Polyangiaceae bacterium]|nr:glutathionylspermidine synthase family protein [Polyangiaceae bacterium]
MSSLANEPEQSYRDFASRVVAGGILADPWISGLPRFREEPLLVSTAQQRLLYDAAEEMAFVYDELCRIVSDDPALLDDFFGLTPCQKAMWFASQPLWHGLARADLFMTAEGPVIAELNCDTPTGEAEAVELNRLVRDQHPGTYDPNRELGPRFCALLDTVARAAFGRAPTPPLQVGLVYPTEFTEDLSLVRLYRGWLEERGYNVLLGSPYNLELEGRGLSLFSASFKLLLRHYKTDWWGERSSVWSDEDIPDPEPLAEPLAAMLTASAEGQVAIINPLAAVVPQNKRAMAFMWEHLQRFSPQSQAAIQRYLPLTSRLEVIHPELLIAEREDWVLKSDYGAEGEEVIIGRHTSDALFRECVAKARPGRWVAQRYFAALENERRESVNYGVYLIAGEASGLYSRIQAGATDVNALSVPTLIVK